MKVVLFCGGLGLRMRSSIDSAPKPMMAVGDRPGLYLRQPFPAWSKLFSRADLTGGAVIDMMIHDYDALNWIFGPPRAATSRRRSASSASASRPSSRPSRPSQGP